jgi:hypothetical protein
MDPTGAARLLFFFPEKSMDFDDPRNRRWLKWVPVAAFVVSCCSFAFAIFVLYPWHIELSREFSTLAKKIPCK